MKKIVILGLTTLIVLSIGSYTYLTSKNEESIDKKEKQIKSTNMLTMMLETEAGTGVYEETTASEWPIDGYVFNETLSKCENGSELSWDNNLKKVIFASTKADKCYIYFDIKKDPTFADYIIDEVYSVDGTNGLYYHDGIGSYTNASEEAGDNSYRYSGANPNNYVCFGSDAATCPNDNLYRIIGLFDDNQDGKYNIKLIKSTSYGYYVWNNVRSNTWNASQKPEIYTTLNTTFWAALNSKWQSLIDQTHIWQVGGMKYSSTDTVKQYYTQEVGTGQTGYIETMAIGLIYVSDYGYSAIPENWQTALYYYNNDTISANIWLYLEQTEWTISRRLDYEDYVFYSNVGSKYPYNTFVVRPVFYLKENVLITEGNGSLNNPYRLSL